ncbi:hypothetical protein JHK87_003827 [Glycine soja]|nr:hypothetical protein JHK87_003827 [Glycine soja]
MMEREKGLPLMISNTNLSSSSSSVMRVNKNLPDEIMLFKILPLLPSKTLIRFRCVCKLWDCFIRDRSFLHLRKLTNNPTHHFLFLSPNQNSSHPFLYGAPHPNNSIVTTPLRPSILFALPNNLQISETNVQCVNGLLCFYPRSHVSFYSHADAFTLIANPTTREIITLPSDYYYSVKANSEFFASTHFGYDPVRDQFKVLRFLKYQATLQVKVFTLGRDTSWRLVTAETPFAMLHLENLLSSHGNSSSLCVNGAIYWRHLDGLLMFDVAAEQFREILVPSGDGSVLGFSLYPDLREIDGCLCLVGFSNHGLKLWILREHETGDLRAGPKASLAVGPILGDLPPLYPLCRVPTGEILLLPHYVPTGVERVNFRAIYYDMDTKSSRSAVIMEMPLTWTTTFREVGIVFCQESFRLLK